MTITINGLSQRQALFADIIWKLNGRDDVERFITSLPSEEQAEARVVMEMMIAAVFDDFSDTDMARDLLTKFRN